RPRHERSALAGLQHRQQPPGGAHDGGWADRAGVRQSGAEGVSADAAGRRARDLCRRQPSGARNPLPAPDPHPGWDGKIRRLVPKLPQGLAHEVSRTQVLRTRESCTLVADESWCAERGTDMSGETERASPRIAVVVPCYNEALTIASVVRRANAA